MLKISAYFDEVIDGDVMGTPRQAHAEFLETGDIGFGKDKTANTQLGDSS